MPIVTNRLIIVSLVTQDILQQMWSWDSFYYLMLGLTKCPFYGAT